MKNNYIIFWSVTIFIALFDGLLPLLTFQFEGARAILQHLGYPEYFGTILVVFKALGAVVLVIPNLPLQLKEWAYAGFGFTFIFACLSNGIVDGFGLDAVFPLMILGLLVISYIYYLKISQVVVNQIYKTDVIPGVYRQY